MAGYLVFAGRLILSLMFIVAALAKATSTATFVDRMARVDMPAIPFFLWSATGLEIIAGIMLLIGLKTRYAAIALGAFTIIVTVVIHQFWAFEEELADKELQSFIKNIVILIILGLVWKFGPGRFAIDNKKSPAPDSVG